MNDNPQTPLKQADLFADCEPTPCVVCGAPFDAPVRRGRGRPLLFCGDVCRRAQLQSQKRRWADAQRAKNDTGAG